MDEVKEQFERKVYINFCSANQYKSARISVTNEFSSPSHLEWIPFPDGVHTYDDLPESFFAKCSERLAFHTAA